MAIFVHRAYDPAGEEYVYWRAEELDLDGTFYAGAPSFNTLENPVLIRRILSGVENSYVYEPVTPGTLVDLEEVS